MTPATFAFAELWAVPYLQEVRHLSATAAASIASVVFMGWVVGGPVMGLVSDMLSRRRLIITVGSVVAFFIISAILLDPGMRLVWLIAALFFYGFFCSVQVLVFAVGREISSNRIAGTSLALVNLLVMLGGVLVQPLVGKVLDLEWNGQMLNGLRDYTLSNYTVALSILPAALLICFFLSLFLRETFCKVRDF